MTFLPRTHIANRFASQRCSCLQLTLRRLGSGPPLLKVETANKIEEAKMGLPEVKLWNSNSCYFALHLTRWRTLRRVPWPCLGQFDFEWYEDVLHQNFTELFCHTARNCTVCMRNIVVSIDAFFCCHLLRGIRRLLRSVVPECIVRSSWRWDKPSRTSFRVFTFQPTDWLLATYATKWSIGSKMRGQQWDPKLTVTERTCQSSGTYKSHWPGSG